MPIVVSQNSGGLLTVLAQSSNLPPRVRLVIDASATPTAVDAVIVRLVPGMSSAVVRQANPVTLASGVAVVYDYEAPFGMASTYTVTTRTSGGVTVSTAVRTVTIDAPVPWLIHLGIPTLSVPLLAIKTFGDRVRKVNQGVFEPFGRRFPIVTTDGRRKSPTGQAQIRTSTLSERDKLFGLLDDASALLLNVPTTLKWGVESEYWQVGDLTEAREIEVGTDPYRAITFPYIVVAPPVGGVQSQRTYQTVLGEATTYADVLTQRAVYLDLLTG